MPGIFEEMGLVREFTTAGGELDLGALDLGKDLAEAGLTLLLVFDEDGDSCGKGDMLFLDLLQAGLGLGEPALGSADLLVLIPEEALTFQESALEVGELLVQISEASLGLGSIVLKLLVPGGRLLLEGGECGELFLGAGDFGAELLQGGGFFFVLTCQFSDGGEPLLMSCLGQLGGVLRLGKLFFCYLDAFSTGGGFASRVGRPKIEHGGKRAEVETVSLDEATAFDAVTIDEGAGGGAEVTHLIATTGMGKDLGVAEGQPLVIDHDVVVLVTTESDTLREGNDDFLSVFECKSEFGHGFCICVLESCQHPLR